MPEGKMVVMMVELVMVIMVMMVEGNHVVSGGLAKLIRTGADGIHCDVDCNSYMRQCPCGDLP